MFFLCYCYFWNAYVIVINRPPSLQTSENVTLTQLIVDFCSGKDVIAVGYVGWKGLVV